MGGANQTQHVERQDPVSVPHQTDEWRWIPVTRTTPDDVTTHIITGVSYAIFLDSGPVPSNPTYTAAEVRGGYAGAKITGLTTGTWRVYAKIDAAPDMPAINCGTFTLD
jgi:hypothetical protein